MQGERTDNQLLRLIARGDESAFAELFDRHADWCQRVARRFAPDTHLAADAVQEALLYLLDAAGTLDAPAGIRPWLYAVVRHRALATARPGKREQSETDRAEIEPHADTELHADLRRAVTALSEPLREALLLRVVDGLSVRETAMALAIAEGTVKSRLSAALAELRGVPNLKRYFD